MNRNGNTENLIPMSERSPAERQEIASKGGKRKAEKAKERKVVADTFNALLELEYDSDFWVELDHDWHYGDLSVNLKGHTVLTSMCANVVYQAVCKGNLKATEIILRYIEPPTKE